MAREPHYSVPETPMPDVDALEEEITRVLGVDDGPPSRGDHGENHTRRPERTEAMKAQGPKTRAANRERVKGSRLYNPR